MATGTVSSLFVKLALDSAEYSRGLTKAEAETQKAFVGMQTKAVAFGTVAADVFVQAVKALYEFAAGTITAKSALVDMTLQTGIAIDKLDGLRKVGMYSGTSMQEIAGAATRLNRALAGAGVDGSSLASRGLKQLGIDVADFKKLNADQQMVKVAQAMNRFADDTDKATVASLLFKQSGPGFLKFLKELGERGIQASQETLEVAQKAKDLEDAMVDLRMKSEELRAEFGNWLIPILKDLVTEVVEGTKAFGGFWKALFGIGFSSPFGTPFERLSKSREEVQKLQEEFDLYQPGGARAGTKGEKDIAAYKRQLDEAKALLRFNQSRVDRELGGGMFEEAGPGEGGNKPYRPGIGQVPPKPTKPKKEQLDEGQKLLKSLEDQILATRNLTEEEKLRTDPDKIAAMEKLTGFEQAVAIAFARQIDEMRSLSGVYEKIGAIRSQAFQAQANETEQLRQSNVQLEEEIALIGADDRWRAMRVRTMLDEQIARKQLDILGMENIEGTEQEVALMREQLRLLERRKELLGDKEQRGYGFSKEAEENIQAMADKSEKALAESISDGIMTGFQNGQSFADVFLNLLKAKFAEAILMPIVMPIAKTGQDMIGSLMQTILKGATGNFTTGQWGSAGPGEAGGGPVEAFGMYRVNELRTEALTVNGEKFLLMGGQGGNVDSNPRLGGGGNFTQVNNIGQGVSRNEVAAALFASQQMMRAEMRRGAALGQMG